MRTAQSGHSDMKSRALHIMMVVYVMKIVQMDGRIWLHFVSFPLFQRDWRRQAAKFRSLKPIVNKSAVRRLKQLHSQ